MDVDVRDRVRHFALTKSHRRAAGKLIGRIRLPERCANVCFGGLKRNRLFMAASQSFYSLYVGTQGAIGG